MNTKSKYAITDNVKNACYIGGVCSVTYFSVYVIRNILSAVTPQILESGSYNTEYIGRISSLFFGFYAVGQLINGIIGERIKSRNMVCFGMLLAGVSHFLFVQIFDYPIAATITYGITGFFLSMIYAPMTKVIAENVIPNYAVRCCLGLTFAALLGSPMAGVIAALLEWKAALVISSVAILFIGIAGFFLFLRLEKKQIITYSQQQKTVFKSQGIQSLFERQIIKFTLIAILTGIVRTSVVFWLPTYLSQYLGFTTEQSAAIFTISTLVISCAAFISAFIYACMNRNMHHAVLLDFSVSAIAFLGAYVISNNIGNVISLIVGIMFANCASNILWSMYCPSLADTGLVSSATGFLDFVSYMAAAISTILFGNSVVMIGWGKMLFLWFLLMVLGVFICLPWRKNGT